MGEDHLASQDHDPAVQRQAETEGPRIFLDCDGVLADFDTYAHAYFGCHPREYERRMGSERFWSELESKGDFYRNLPLMEDARVLVEGVRHLNPTILTGCPRGNWAEAQKVAWAEEHFPGVPIITCRSADKRDHAKPGDVLIDDWPQHRHRWIAMGGVFISHFDAESSLAALWAHYPTLHPMAPPSSEVPSVGLAPEGTERVDIRADREAELGDFISALFEWGSDDPHDQAAEVMKFLRSPVGLEVYRVEEGECAALSSAKPVASESSRDAINQSTRAGGDERRETVTAITGSDIWDTLRYVSADEEAVCEWPPFDSLPLDYQSRLHSAGRRLALQALSTTPAAPVGEGEGE